MLQNLIHTFFLKKVPLTWFYAIFLVFFYKIEKIFCFIFDKLCRFYKLFTKEE